MSLRLHSNSQGYISIKITSWNIAAWASKIVDTSFKEFIKDSEILFFQETWSQHDLVLDGFTSYVLKTPPSDKGGRYKGGLWMIVS